MSFIEFENVSKYYEMGEVEIKALDSVSFQIEKGEFAVILGASGAGKTTILNLLGGMDKASSGHIVVDGRDISEFNDKQLCMYRRNDIGFVFQFYNLVTNITALENVQLASQIVADPLDSETVLEMVGLQNRLDNFPSQLSGGEQQRVAIARAVAKNPKILLCDEPTGALDGKTGQQVLKVLVDMCENYHMSVIMITHNEALSKLGDTIIHIKDGHVESIEKNAHKMRVEEIEY